MLTVSATCSADAAAEQPAHLQRALQAAAAARARTARIRADRPDGAASGDPPPSTAARAGAAAAPDSVAPRFRRTAAVAQESRTAARACATPHRRPRDPENASHRNRWLTRPDAAAQRVSHGFAADGSAPVARNGDAMGLQPCLAAAAETIPERPPEPPVAAASQPPSWTGSAVPEAPRCPPAAAPAAPPAIGPSATGPARDLAAFWGARLAAPMQFYRNALATCRGWRAVSAGAALSEPADRPASRTPVASGDVDRSWLRAALAVAPAFSRRAPARSAAGVGAGGRPALVAAWLSAFVCAAIGGFALGVITGDGLPTSGAGAGEAWANHGARVDGPIPPAPAPAAAGG